MRAALNFLIRLAILNFIFVGALFFTFKNKESQKITSSSNILSLKTSPTITTSTDNEKTITAVPTTESVESVPTDAPQQQADPFSELPNHSNPGDCWMVINGHIYDITTYFGSHPGGDALLAKYCGQDGTTAFATKEKEMPQDHSSFAKGLLQQYLIQ